MWKGVGLPSAKVLAKSCHWSDASSPPPPGSGVRGKAIYPELCKQDITGRMRGRVAAGSDM